MSNKTIEAHSQTEIIDTEYINKSVASKISPFLPANINEHLIYSRAFDAVIWGMPAVNFELFVEALTKAKADFNQVIYWSGLLTSKNQTLTPNPDVIYLNPFYDTRRGPVVMEIPAADEISSITGSLDDGWQTAIEDVGPAGVDKGKGGKYLILPPGYNDKLPEGYIPMPSSTFTGFAILRSNLKDGSEKDLARAIDYGKRVKLYPYSMVADPPPTKFVDLLNIEFNTTIPYNIHFFELLNEFIQREAWLLRDMAMIDPLKTIGIEKGKPFQPDARTIEILNTAINDTHVWLDKKYEQVYNQPYYEGAHWAFPVSQQLVKAISENYQAPDIYPVDERAVLYSMAYFSAKHLGAGQFYLMTIKDSDGNSLDGANLYQLHLPANVPVSLYWSATAYDLETHALITGVKPSSRASTTPGLQKNSDGSVDVYFGPKAPAGIETNWVPTKPERKFEIMVRFYGPGKELFDKTWKMGDVKRAE